MGWLQERVLGWKLVSVLGYGEGLARVREMGCGVERRVLSGPVSKIISRCFSGIWGHWLTVGSVLELEYANRIVLSVDLLCLEHLLLCSGFRFSQARLAGQ